MERSQKLVKKSAQVLNQALQSKHLRRLSIFLKIALLAAVLYLAYIQVADQITVGDFLSSFAALNLVVLLAVLVLMFLGILASCWRFHSIMSSLGLIVSRSDAYRANILGIVGGMFFFQLAGQTITRAAILKRFRVSAAEVLFVNLYERLLAVACLFIFALLAAVFLFSSMTFDLESGAAPLAKLSVSLLLAFAACWHFPWRRPLANAFRKLNYILIVANISKSALQTMLVQSFVLAAYVVLALTLVPTASLDSVIAASLVVMFAASLPISFAGWGVRELSAVYAYGAIGIPTEQALVISVAIGLSSLLLMVLLSGWALFDGDRISRDQTTRQDVVTRSFKIDRLLQWGLPLLAGFLVLFQVHIPTTQGKLNVNLADPVAIAGGVIFLLLYFKRQNRHATWRIPRFEYLLIGITGLLTLGLLLGIYRFGVSDWALVNRYFGWMVLLGYLFTGALVCATAGRVGRTVLMRTTLTALTVLAFGDVLLLWLRQVEPAVVMFLPSGEIFAMAQNSNAFAFQLLAMAAMFLPFLRHSTGLISKPMSVANLTPILIAVILGLALLYSGSRAAYVTIGVMMVVALPLRWVRLDTMLLIGAGVVLGHYLPSILPMIASFILGSDLWTPAIGGQIPLQITHAASDGERMYTINQGLELWRQYPIFGGGLGSYLATEAANGQPTLVIHNTLVWLLAELGLVGFLTFCLAGGHLIHASLKPAFQGQIWARQLLLLGLMFAVFQMAHDVLYQRILWLLLGALLVQQSWKSMGPGVRYGKSV